MKRGDSRDFWRSAAAGRQLEKLGWIPWSLYARRRIRGVVQDLRLGPWACEVSAGSPPRPSAPANLPASRRARLIREALAWLPTSGWTAFSLSFRLKLGGRRWTLLSDVHFNRGEGLYWSNSLKAPMGAGVDRDLVTAGFRVYPREPGQWYFHQDFLPPSRLLKKAAWLAAWRPTNL